jgi:hypothetical protein
MGEVASRRLACNIDYSAGCADRVEGPVGSSVTGDGDLGCALISVAMKITPALAAANTVVVKGISNG